MLKLALISFDHFNADAHDSTVQAGAIEVLVKGLHQAAYSQNGAIIVEKICKLTIMLLRCSEEAATNSICSHMTEIVTLLGRILNRSCTVEPTDKSSVEATKLWMRMAIDSVPLTMIHNHDLLLLYLVRLIRNASPLNESACLSALKFTVQLASHPESRGTIMQYPGLIDVIIDRASTDECSKVITECVKIIESLLRDAQNRAEYLKRPRSLAPLINQCRGRDAKACLHAARALKQLSLEANFRQKLSRPEILGALIRLVIIPSSSDRIKLECLQTMSNVICVKTAEHFMAYSGLLKELAKVATCSCLSDQVRSLAARAIKRLSTHVHPRHASHTELFEAIETMSSAKGRLVRLWTARALVEQSLLAGSSFLMVRTSHVMDTLIRLAACDYIDVRAATFEALANLAQEPANARRISTNTVILELLVRTVHESHNLESEEARRQAVRAVLLMASNHSSTKRVAKHLGLVSCLSRYGTSDDEDYELKQAALNGVVFLAPMI